MKLAEPMFMHAILNTGLFLLPLTASGWWVNGQSLIRGFSVPAKKRREQFTKTWYIMSILVLHEVNVLYALPLFK